MLAQRHVDPGVHRLAQQQGEAVDARVYVPLRDLAPEVVSTWMDEPTSKAGRHRAR